MSVLHHFLLLLVILLHNFLAKSETFGAIRKALPIFPMRFFIRNSLQTYQVPLPKGRMCLQGNPCSTMFEWKLKNPQMYWSLQKKATTKRKLFGVGYQKEINTRNTKNINSFLQDLYTLSYLPKNRDLDKKERVSGNTKVKFGSISRLPSIVPTNKLRRVIASKSAKESTQSSRTFSAKSFKLPTSRIRQQSSQQQNTPKEKLLSVFHVQRRNFRKVIEITFLCRLCERIQHKYSYRKLCMYVFDMDICN